eukprot:9637952-Alexandrium_andersonii.AAC.1
MPQVAVRHMPQSEQALQTSLRLAGRSGSSSAGSRKDLMADMGCLGERLAVLQESLLLAAGRP